MQCRGHGVVVRKRRRRTKSVADPRYPSSFYYGLTHLERDFLTQLFTSHNLIVLRYPLYPFLIPLITQCTTTRPS